MTPTPPPPSLRVTHIIPPWLHPMASPAWGISTWFCFLASCFPWVYSQFMLHFCPHPVICFFCLNYVWDPPVFVSAVYSPTAVRIPLTNTPQLCLFHCCRITCDFCHPRLLCTYCTSSGDQRQVFPGESRSGSCSSLKDDAPIVFQTCCTCFHFQRQGGGSPSGSAHQGDVDSFSCCRAGGWKSHVVSVVFSWWLTRWNNIPQVGGLFIFLFGSWVLPIFLLGCFLFTFFFGKFFIYLAANLLLTHMW